MELTINKTRGLIELLEFKTTEKTNIFFDNNFGMIKDNEMLLYRTMLTYDLNEIVAIEITKDKSKFSAFIIYGGILLIAFLFLEVNIVSIIGSLILARVLLFLKKPKGHLLQITFCNETRKKNITIGESELSHAIRFVKAYHKYKIDK